jgi:hypothetical protein
VDGKSGRTVYVHHAALNRLHPGTDYVYLAAHEGATPDSGTFRTAPRGRAPLTFTSFGDQAAPQVSWGSDGTPVLDNNSTPASKDIVTGIEQVAPLFHLLNGDLCYAHRDVDRVRTWNNFFTNNTRSARFRGRYGVDLVVCGHEHNYERSLAVRGVVHGSETLTPNPVSSATDVIDTSLGTVHMVLGGGGVSGTTNQSFFKDGTAKVITAYNGGSVYVKEQAVWAGTRDADHPYGFAAFTVDPGRHPGDTTRMHVTYYNVNKPNGQLSVFEQFTLHRKRSDGER